MSFSQKEFIFSHTMSRVTQAHQPAMFKIDLRDLIPCGDYCSTLFTIDNMSITAYKQGTWEKTPVKFTVLNDNRRRVLTNDLSKLSSKWQVDGGDSGSCMMKIAGTDTVPFRRTLSVYDEENRQAFVNLLAFMMSNSLFTSDRARGAFEVLLDSTQGEFQFTCDLCSEIGVACVTKGPGGGLPSFSLPQCADSYVCIPCQQPCADKDYEALRNLLALLRSASLDNIGLVQRVTREMVSKRSFQEDMASDCSFQECAATPFPSRYVYTRSRNVVLPYEEVKYVTSLYRAMSEYADNFAVVDLKTPHVKVLIESPSENIGEITGCLSLTVIYGSTLLDIYNKLNRGLWYAEGCAEARDEEQREQQQQQQQQQIESLTNITQLSTDVLIRRMPLNFMLTNHMSLLDWYNFYYG